MCRCRMFLLSMILEVQQILLLKHPLLIFFGAQRGLLLEILLLTFSGAQQILLVEIFLPMLPEVEQAQQVLLMLPGMLQRMSETRQEYLRPVPGLGSHF